MKTPLRSNPSGIVSDRGFSGAKSDRKSFGLREGRVIFVKAHEFRFEFLIVVDDPDPLPVLDRVKRHR